MDETGQDEAGFGGGWGRLWRRWKRIERWALVILAVVICACLLRQHWRLTRIRAQTGIPAVAEDPENRAAHYLAAAWTLVPPRDRGYDNVRVNGERVEQPAGMPAKEELVKALDERAVEGVAWDESLGWVDPFIDGNSRTLEILRTAAAQPACDMPMLFGEAGPLRTPRFRTYEAISHTALLVNCAARRSLWRGEQAEAVRLGVMAVQMGLDVGSDGPCPQASVGLYASGLGCQALALAITSGPLDEEALVLIDEGARACDLPVPDPEEIARRDRDFMLLHQTRGARGYILCAFGLRGLLARYSRMGYGLYESSGELADAYRAAFEYGMFTEQDRLNASLRLLRVGVAVQRFARDKGRLPETLADLVPACLDVVPEEPLGRGVLEAEAGEGTFRVYYQVVDANGHEVYMRALTFRADRLLASG
ncbi:MAG: hypothetical protein JXR94_15170 [Candidatus Hydrogenedentes bacterium]|nr:hypothetical protein [Candidatus Hydrogenedentota bacterium]